MATSTSSALSCSPVARRFGSLCCPKCGEANACIALELGDFSADDALHCKECDETFSVALIRDILASWPRVLAWLDSAPPAQE